MRGSVLIREGSPVVLRFHGDGSVSKDGKVVGLGWTVPLEKAITQKLGGLKPSNDYVDLEITADSSLNYVVREVGRG